MGRTGILAAVGLLVGCGGDEPPAQAAAQPGSPAETRSSSPDAPTRSESRAFRDWRAVCDNSNECVAFGPASGGIGWIRVGASPGPAGALSVNVGLWPGEAPADAVTLDLDGRRYVARSEQGSDDFRVAAADAPSVISGLAAGRSMSVNAGGSSQAVSLTGATAALLWIDERQGRLDTVAALVRRGRRPATAVPAAPALPVVTPAPSVAQTGYGDSGQTLPAALEALPAVKACREETSHSEWVQKEVMSARLNATTELWAVPCFVGAYNMGQDWYLADIGGRNPRPLRLPSANGETGSGTINGGYAANSRTLTAFAKGRGIGDCGTAQTWTWTGRAFVLTAETEMQECWGVPADLWPTTWRTRER